MRARFHSMPVYSLYHLHVVGEQQTMKPCVFYIHIDKNVYYNLHTALRQYMLFSVQILPFGCVQLNVSSAFKSQHIASVSHQNHQT